MPQQPAFDAVAAHDYWTLMGALLERKRRLGLTNEDVDFLGGLPSGYAGKLFCGSRTMGIDSIGKMLAALNARLIVVAGERSAAVVPAHAIEICRLDAQGKDIRRSEWGKKGHAKWMCLSTKAQRRKNAIHASKASVAARAQRKAEQLRREQLREAKAAALMRLDRDRRPRVAAPAQTGL